MVTPATRALERVSPRVRRARIYNYLAREGRLNTYAEEISRRGVVTVRDFVIANEAATLADIRLTPGNRERIERLLRLFGFECSLNERIGQNGAPHSYPG